MPKKTEPKNKAAPPQVSLPKDALQRINLGQAFAEYDHVLTQPGVFVMTPAVSAAMDPSRCRCFFVGRRGTGKTALAHYVSAIDKMAVHIHPRVLSPLDFPDTPHVFRDPRQRPFRSLLEAFKRALQDEVLSEWDKRKIIKPTQLPSVLAPELRFAQEYDFDLRLLRFLRDICTPLFSKQEDQWLRQIGKSKPIGKAMAEVAIEPAFNFTLLIDRIDDSWDGSDTAVIMLMALMHACIELLASVKCVRPLLFIRENLFDRVRQVDHESTRLETCVVSMNWTRELLLEMVERRLNLPFHTKLPLRGPTWNYFFESASSQSSESLIFDFCQEQPRDVLTYCSFAIEQARSRKHERVTVTDVLEARRRFSETRLKDLGDEYAENFPRIALVLSRFYGLGREFTLQGVDAFIRKLLNDEEVKAHCSAWIYNHIPPEQFTKLLYNIGFVGIKKGGNVDFRSVGPSSSSPPAVTADTHIVIHPSYADALDLRDVVISHLEEGASWQAAGFLTELPGAIELQHYTERLERLLDELRTLPEGRDHSARWEDAVGQVIRLCFYRWLANVEPSSRELDGRNVRDWIVANRAESGFWEMVRQRYDATQVVWECKNCSNLESADFQQIAYYMNTKVGRFAIIAFRGEIKKHYYQHIRRIADDSDALVILLTTKDLQVFVRQAMKGKFAESHIQDIFDRTIRSIS